jgi:hypothetical protein
MQRSLIRAAWILGTALALLLGQVFGAQQVINLGTPNSGTGDSLYDAFTKVSSNFNELYSGVAMGGVAIKRGTNTLSYTDLPTAFAALQSGDTMTIAGGTWPVDGHYYTTDIGDIPTTGYLWIQSLTNVTIQGIGHGTILSITNYGNGITIDSCRNITLRDMTIIGSTNGMSGSTWIQAAINHRRTNDQTTVHNVASQTRPFRTSATTTVAPAHPGS